MLIGANEHKFLSGIKYYLGYTAPLELLFSLNALVAPENHPDCANWASKKYSSLSNKLRSEIDFFAIHYGNWFFAADVGIHLAEGLSQDECTVERITSDILNMDILEFAYIFLGFSAFNLNKTKLSNWFENPRSIKKSDLGEQAAFFMLEDVIYFFENPDQIRRRMVNAILLYWEECFKDEWRKLEAFGRKSVIKERQILNSMDPLEYVKKLHPNILIDGEKLVFKKTPEYYININNVRTLDITLSVFLGSYLGVNIVGDKLCITKNLSFQAAKIDEPVPDELVECLRACSDETRLKMLKIFWSGNATTQGLSKVLGMSPGAVSLQLKQLKAAGLVDSYKENKYVYYFIKPDIIKKLSDTLQDYFEG